MSNMYQKFVQWYNLRSKSIKLLLLSLPIVLVTLVIACSYWLYASKQAPTQKVVTHSANTTTENGGYPYVSGNTMYDDQGHKLILRGAMLESPFAYIHDYITRNKNPLDTLNAKTFQAMHDWKMNAVRINISQWIEQADTSGQYLLRLDKAISDANNAGLYVILDFHNDAQSGSPNGDEGRLHKSSESWWLDIANRYKNNGHILFDLINEPKYTSWQEWEYGDGADIVGLLDVTNTLRQNGIRNIIVLEPGASAGGQLKAWEGFSTKDITDKNSIVSKHIYGEIPQYYLSGNPTVEWNKEWGGFLHTRPLIYGEWAVLPHPDHPAFCGKGMNSANADAMTNAFLDYMQSIGASWTAWSFTPTHMIDSWTSLQPTSMQTGAPWTCPVKSGAALNAGMGTDIKEYLTTHS